MGRRDGTETCEWEGHAQCQSKCAMQCSLLVSPSERVQCSYIASGAMTPVVRVELQPHVPSPKAART